MAPLLLLLVLSLQACQALAGNNTSAPACNTKLFKNASEAEFCFLADSYCPDDGYINYLQLYYCHNHAWVLVVMCFLLVILLYNLGEVADSHFCPCLERLSNGLRLSPTVAGPTLLALGNGAPDISTSLVAILSGEGAESMGVVTPLGSGVFITAVVLALVTWSSHWRVHPGVIARDIGFYLLAIIALWIILADGKLWLFEGILLLLLYAVYVVVVVFTDKWLVLKSEDEPVVELAAAGSAQALPAESGEEDLEVVQSDLGPEFSSFGGSSSIPPGEDCLLQIENGTARSPSNDHAGRISRPLLRVMSAPVLGTLLPCHDAQKRSASASHAHFRRGPSSFLAVVPAPASVPFHVAMVPPELLQSANTAPLVTGPLEAVRRTMFRFYFSRYRLAARHNLLYHNTSTDVAPSLSPRPAAPPTAPLTYCTDWRQFWEAFRWTDKNWLQRCASLLQLPFKVAYLLNIPPATDTEWNKLRAVLCPIFAPSLCLLAFLSFNPVGFAIAISGGLCGSLAIHFLTEHQQPPQWSMVFTVMAFGMSIMWIYVIANEVVNLLECLGVIFGLSESTLAVTVLAFGNCIGDAAADTAVARQGLGAMAVSAIYGGPLLPLLTSLGVAFTYNAARQYPDPYVMGKMSADAAFTLWALALSLLLGFFVLLATHFRSHYLGGTVHFLFYSTFLTVLLLYEFDVLSLAWLPFPDTYCVKERSYFGGSDTETCRVL